MRYVPIHDKWRRIPGNGRREPAGISAGNLAADFGEERLRRRSLRRLYGAGQRAGDAGLSAVAQPVAGQDGDYGGRAV